MSARVRGVLAIVLLVAAAVLTYHRAVSAYFYDDDLQWLVGSWAFTPSSLWAFGGMTHFYRPVIDLYFALATPLFHGSPVLFHLANIAVHACNGVVLFALLSRVAGSRLYGFAAALFFVVQPAGIDAVAWVGALAEAVGALFGCLSVLWFLEWEHTGSRTWRVLSAAAFAAALLTHESSVVFLLVLPLVDWASARGAHEDRAHAHSSREPHPPPFGTGQVGAEHAVVSGKQTRWRDYGVYGCLTAAYLAIDLAINSRNYIVREGHYAVGWHMIPNALRYVVSLYVGRQDLANYVLATLVLGVLLLRGNRRVQCATLWMLVALLPFLPFTWANTSRYLYQPAIGLSMLVAEAVMQLDRFLAPRVNATRRTGLVTVVVAVVAVRFMLFAMHNIEGFAGRTDVYRTAALNLRSSNGDLPSHSVVVADAALKTTVKYPFANALTSWVYHDPTITLAPY
jgi:hypothetical protein